MAHNRYVEHAVTMQDGTDIDIDTDLTSEEEPLVTASTLTKRTAAGFPWRQAVLAVTLILVGLVLLFTFTPASTHLPPQLLALRSAVSLFSVTLPSSSVPLSSSNLTAVTDAADSDPFYRIAPATSTYTNHVCLNGFGGRWGNHIYMMNNALYIALKHNLTLHLPLSDNEPILPHMHRFTTPCPTTNISEVHRNDLWWTREQNAYWDVDPRVMPENHNFTRFKLTLGGYMQYPTSAHASRRADIRAFYAPQPDLRQLMDRLRTAIMTEFCGDSIVVAIHIRAGDFPKAENWNYSSNVDSPLQIPITWYINWLHQLAHNTTTLQQLKAWQDADCPHQPPSPLHPTHPFSVFLATEDFAVNANALRAAGYRTLGVQQAVLLTPGLGNFTALTGKVGSFWAEWWLLAQFRVLATSHSSFSLTAALQSPYYEAREAVYATPDPVTLSIQRFDPWNVSYDHAAFSRRGKQIVFG